MVCKRFGGRRKSIEGGEAGGGRSEAERRGDGRDDQQDRSGTEGDGQDVGDRACLGRIGGGKQESAQVNVGEETRRRLE